MHQLTVYNLVRRFEGDMGRHTRSALSAVPLVSVCSGLPSGEGLWREKTLIQAFCKLRLSHNGVSVLEMIAKVRFASCGETFAASVEIHP